MLTGCVATDKLSSLPTAKTNLTSAEIRVLPDGTTFKDIKKRLRYYTTCEVALPLISFEVEGESGTDCVMLFEDKTKLLLYAWICPLGDSLGGEALFIWPRSCAGKKFSELEGEIEKKIRANQALLPTPMSVTPPAGQEARQP